MKVYAIDYILFTNAKMKDEIVDKIIDTMANNKADLVASRRRCTTSRSTRCIASTTSPITPAR